MQIAFGRVRRKASPAERGRGVSVVRRGSKPRLLFWRTAPTFLEDRAYFFGGPRLLFWKTMSCVVIGFQLGFTFVLPNLRDDY